MTTVTVDDLPAEAAPKIRWRTHLDRLIVLVVLVAIWQAGA